MDRIHKFESIWRRKGFTLIEILVVIVIISILASIVTLEYFNRIEKAKRDSAKAQIELLGSVLDTFRLEIGRYPTTEEGLDALVNAPADLKKWRGPYLKKGKKVPKDPWENDYVYLCPGIHGDYDLISHGADGIEGGEGKNADVFSWDE